MTTATQVRDRFLAAARADLGYGERADGSTKMGSWYARLVGNPAFTDAPWCQASCGYWANEAGIPDTVIPRMAYTPYAVKWFKDRGRYGSTPKVGALVYYNWPGGDFVDHVEIVEAVRADGSIVTIGANVANAVRRQVRKYGIVGYGYPDFAAAAAAETPPVKPIEVVYKDGVPQWPGRVLKLASPYMSGKDVKTWQQKLSDRGWTIDVDGEYGPQSRGVARSYREATGLPAGDTVDRATWDMTWSWRPPEDNAKTT